MNGKGIIALFAIAVLVALPGCAKSPEEKAREERRAADRAKIAGLEKDLASQSDGNAKAGILQQIIGIEVMNLQALPSAMDRYEKNKALLSKDVLSRCYYAVSLSMQAGNEKKIENKLKWLRRGMNSFESLREEFPDDPIVYLYQASTYANFPAEVGARDEVLGILSIMRDRYASKAWPMDAPGQIGYVYSSLEANFKDKESAALIEAHRDGFAAAVPAFAEAQASEKARAAK